MIGENKVTACGIAATDFEDATGVVYYVMVNVRTIFAILIWDSDLFLVVGCFKTA